MGLFAKQTQQTAPKNTANMQGKQTTSQKSIPYVEVYKNGMVQSKPGVFSMTWEFPDVAFKTLSNEDQDAFFERFMTFLNTIDATEHVTFHILNTIDDIELRFATVSLKERGDNNDQYRREMNQVILNQMQNSRGAIITKRYLTYAIFAPSVDNAVARFRDIEIKVIKEFRTFIQQEPHLLTLAERMEFLATVYGTNNSVYFMHDEKGNVALDFENMNKAGLCIKDVIAPSVMSFKMDHFIMGEQVGQSMYLSGLANLLSTDFIGNIADINTKMLLSIDIYPLDQTAGAKLIHNSTVLVNNEIASAQKQAVKNGYSPELISQDLLNTKQQLQNLQEDITSRDQKIFYSQMTLTHFAPDVEALRRNTMEIQSVAGKNLCNFTIYNLRQEFGLNACLPLGLNNDPKEVPTKRALTTESMAAFMPFTEMSTFDETGIYYGSNSINKSVIVLDRWKGMNYNGLIFGASGSGKSFSAKREMINAILNTNDDLFIIDPDGEYLPLAQAFGGSEIEIAPGNGKNINPFDLDIDTGNDKKNNPVVLQADFIAGIVETMQNRGSSRYLMSSSMTAVLTRCINKVYDGYLEHLKSLPPEPDGSIRTIDRDAAPTLQDLFQTLLQQPEPEGKELALDIEPFVSGNYDTFAHRTNVDITNRFTIFNIMNIGNNLRELGLKVCLNMIWNKAVENRKIGKRTWVYIDEFHLLLATPTSAEFIAAMWKRARKFGCSLTGITQNPEDVLKSSSSRAIMSNTNFVEMLNQSAMDAKALQQLLTLSSNELQYITNVNYGRGLIKFGTTTIPFKDDFPADTKLYEIMNTKIEQ